MWALSQQAMCLSACTPPRYFPWTRALITSSAIPPFPLACPEISLEGLQARVWGAGKGREHL